MNIVKKEKEKKHKEKNGRGLRIMYIVLGCVFAVLFALFALPILGYVLNIGNILGMAFCGIMMFLTFGHKYVEKLVGTMKENVFGRIVVYAVPVVFLLGVVYIGFLTSLIVTADRKPPEEDATVIVLGCQVRGDHPSLMLWQRICTAADYLEEHPDAVCIVSGGKGNDEQISEAQCMFDHLTAKGISADRVYIEDRSTNTVENIAFSKEIIEREGMSTNTAIVTDIFHEYRASRIVENAGLSCGSVPAGVSWYLLPTFYVRELVAITAVFLGLA